MRQTQRIIPIETLETEDYEYWLREAEDRNMAERDREQIRVRIGVDFATMKPRYLNPRAFDPKTTYGFDTKIGAYIKSPDNSPIALVVCGGELPKTLRLIGL